MDFFAHRGGCPENQNSVSAVKKAAKKCGRVEIDVRQCKTGEIVVIHDGIVEVNGRAQSVDNTAFNDFQESASKSVPRLKEVLDNLPKNTILNVELKEQGFESQLPEICSNYPIHVVYSSFLKKPLEALQDYETAYIFLTGWHSKMEKALEINCNALHPANYITTSKRVSMAKEQGLDIRPWTVNNYSEASRLKDAGVDAIISDNLNLLKKISDRP